MLDPVSTIVVVSVIGVVMSIAVLHTEGVGELMPITEDDGPEGLGECEKA